MMVKVIRGKKGWLTVQALREGYGEEVAGMGNDGYTWTVEMKWDGERFTVISTHDDLITSYRRYEHSSQARTAFTALQATLRDQSTNT